MIEECFILYNLKEELIVTFFQVLIGFLLGYTLAKAKKSEVRE